MLRMWHVSVVWQPWGTLAVCGPAKGEVVAVAPGMTQNAQGLPPYHLQVVGAAGAGAGAGVVVVPWLVLVQAAAAVAAAASGARAGDGSALPPLLFALLRPLRGAARRGNKASSVCACACMCVCARSLRHNKTRRKQRINTSIRPTNKRNHN